MSRHPPDPAPTAASGGRPWRIHLGRPPV